VVIYDDAHDDDRETLPSLDARRFLHAL